MRFFSAKLLIFFVNFGFVWSSFAGEVLYQIESFSSHAHKMIADDGKNAIYNVFVNRVNEFLPNEYGIRNRIVKSVDIGVLPGKPLVKLIRHMVVTFDPTVRMERSKVFFGRLSEGVPHTYTISPYHLVFTESTCVPMEEQCKDKLSKHYFISNMAHKLRFAGQFYVYKNDSDEVTVVFDNSSGTYRPDNSELRNLKTLLELNFPDQGLHFQTKAFDEDIDQTQLFDHENTQLKNKMI